MKTFKEYFGKGPTSAKSYMVDDLLFVVMRDGLTEVETFLLEQDEADVVRQYRQTFGNHMDKILSDKIEALTAGKWSHPTAKFSSLPTCRSRSSSSPIAEANRSTPSPLTRSVNSWRAN